MFIPLFLLWAAARPLFSGAVSIEEFRPTEGVDSFGRAEQRPGPSGRAAGGQRKHRGQASDYSFGEDVFHGTGGRKWPPRYNYSDLWDC